jgi:MFS transporter, PPP family, 3-phenylpropionic acid transporter
VPRPGAALAGAYACTFGMTGVLASYLPPYLKSLGLTSTQLGLSLAMPTMIALLAPNVWGALADRTGRPERVLQGIAAGTAISLLPLLWAHSFAAALAALLAYGVFSSSIPALLDAMAIDHCAAARRSYAGLRRYGSLGYAIACASYGLLVGGVGAVTLQVALAWAVAFAAVTWALHAPAVAAVAAVAPLRPHPLDGLRLLRRRPIAWLLVVTCLHWIACAPQNGLFAIHLASIGLEPWVAGVAVGAGVCSELVVMSLVPYGAHRIAARTLLALAIGAGSLRWLALSFASSAPAVIGTTLLHGLTFGAFYLAALTLLASEVPPRLRSSGQALFVSVTFGLGGLIGLVLAGRFYDALGGATLFRAAAGLEVVVALLALAAPRALGARALRAAPLGSAG